MDLNEFKIFFKSIFPKYKLEIFRSIFILTSLWYSPLSIAQNADYKIGTLPNETAITQNVVSAITTDKNGFLWFGKMDGLYKYNGYDYEIFNTSFHDQTGLSNPWVTDIKTINDTLLIGTKNGLNFFNHVKQEFSYLFPSDFNPNYSNNITCILPLSDKKLIIGTDINSLVLSKQKKNTFKVSKLIFEGYSLSHKIKINQIVKISQGSIILSSEGVFFLENEHTRAKKIAFIEKEQQKTINPKTIYLTKSNNLFFASEKETYFIDLNLQSPKDNSKLYASPISTLYKNWPILQKATVFLEDINENIFIGTDGNGLYLYEKSSEKWYNFKHEMNNKNVLKNDFIRSLNTDKSGMIVIGTDAGINIIDTQKNKFNLINNIQTTKGRTEILNVHSILEDDQQNLWIGTRGKGLFLLGKNGKEQYNITTALNHPLDHIKAIFQDRKKNIWIGTKKGIYIINNGYSNLNKIATEFKNRKADLLPEEYIYGIIEDSEENKWISTEDGLYFYSVKGQLHKINLTFTRDNLNNLSIYTMHIDKKNRIWFGTLNGLIVYINPNQYKNKVFSNTEDINSIKFNTIEIAPSYKKFYENYETYSIVETNHGLMVGTNFGLCKINSEEQLLYPFFNKSQSTNNYTLQSNYVYGLLYDNLNDLLWASTNKGLISYSFKNNIEKNYKLKDGLQSLEFNGNSVFKNAKNDFYFGGANGVNILTKGNTLKKSEFEPNLVLTKLTINGEVINTKKHPELLTTDISYAKKIKLEATNNNIELEFASLHLPYASNNNYKCKLIGLDEDWIQLGHRRSINYANLPKGNYTFQLMGTNNDGVWNSNVLTFDIEVLPQWYKTWWMLLLWYLISFGIIASFIYIILKNRDNLNNLKIKEFESKKLQEVYESKLVFFTNLSHEFRTPLSLIIDPFNSLMNQKDFYKKNKVLFDIIKSNVDRLSRLIDQIMDFRKFEYGKLSLRIAKGNINGTISTICSSFIHHSKLKNVNYQIDISTKPVTMFYDSDSIEKIVYNLLSNAFKAVKDNGKVKVSVKEVDMYCKSFTLKNYKYITGEKSVKNFNNHICIKVKDNGVGISDKNLENIFTRFYQDDGVDSGTGIGLYMVKQFTEMHFGSIFIKSKKNKGTSFVIILPKNDDLFKESKLTNKVDVKVPPIQYNNEIVLQLPEQNQEILKKKQYSIAIVEDNDELRMYLKNILETHYNVYLANNGLEGLDLIKDEIPDIVISDVVMPEIDGVTMCKKIKENFETSHIPVILLTAKTLDNQIIEGINSGADDYITKPFNRDILLAKLKSIIKNREKLRLTFQNEKILEPSKITVTSIDEKLILKLKKLIEKNIQNQQLTLEMLATEIGVSRAQLFRKVKALTGLTPNNFIKAIRLKYAAQLLDNDKFQITEVAFLSGFNEASYFSRCFKENFGCSPKEYKKSDETK
ncbi:hybrid sensor histidine kinase/response regulator [Aureibaculum marinum]|uniref:histidine kinase n=1 Tax=Aureibaculum marinum TaxID=2487930 RepID=A0A3N4P511_9FLAO|nr:hybrid sensor histidine kinase/response regulator transcription factor [Aureibaculum marinum]RPD99976.1 hybrid sensor histidine kinase/response regulator [Aureibaculum marinum]